MTSRAYTNDPPLLILTSLADGEKHGYALLQDIERFAGVRLGPGTLYGAIGRLEERGLIEPAGGDAEPGHRRRRPYRITGAGERSLDVGLAELRAVVDEGLSRLAAARPARPARAGGAA